MTVRHFHGTATNQSRLPSISVCLLLTTLLLLHTQHIDAFTNQHQASLQTRTMTHRTQFTESSTTLNAWSISAVALPTLPKLTRKELPVHALGSWYQEVDPTNALPVYDDEYENSYLFGSPTDDWSADYTNEVLRQEQQTAVPCWRPLTAIRRIAGQFVDKFV